MYRVVVTRADLWGNIQDGMDWNQSFKCTDMVEPRGTTLEQAQATAELLAKGNIRESLPLKANGKRYHTCGRQCFELQWSDEFYADVVCSKYGIAIGAVTIEDFQG